jgi:hypothetical protein
MGIFKELADGGEEEVFDLKAWFWAVFGRSIKTRVHGLMQMEFIHA